MIPAGRLLIIGNTKCTPHLDITPQKTGYPLLSSDILHCLAKEKDDRIEIIVSDARSDSFKKECHDALTETGFSNFDFLHIHDLNLPDEDYYLKRLSKAKTIFFVGDQSRTYDILKRSGIIRFLYRKYMFDSGFTIAGMSLGALCIPGIMLVGREDSSSGMIPGLGFLTHCIVDSQFVHKTRFEKLASTVIQHREFLGLGLGSDTALIIEKGWFASCRGTGTIMVINARNVKKESNESSVYVKNLKGRILINGCTINLMNGEVA
ncbi:cyanophycinase [Chryseobacterium oranimense]|uniref:cyanophycinase n=1 Tax=Chryseobacterium oranimense TaxID=421058 RepID=UPI0022358E3D|nr:Type 1 glutamine amidotransferase-like domain-containing protein [Chryseobacterium oranimense]